MGRFHTGIVLFQPTFLTAPWFGWRVHCCQLLDPLRNTVYRSVVVASGFGMFNRSFHWVLQMNLIWIEGRRANWSLARTIKRVIDILLNTMDFPCSKSETCYYLKICWFASNSNAWWIYFSAATLSFSSLLQICILASRPPNHEIITSATSALFWFEATFAIPALLVGPAYLKGEVQFGVISQVGWGRVNLMANIVFNICCGQ